MKVGDYILVWVHGYDEYPWEGKIMEEKLGRWMVLDPLGGKRIVNKAVCSSVSWARSGDIPNLYSSGRYRMKK